MRGLAFGAVMLAAAVLVLRGQIAVVTVCGMSMQPTYHDGDRVLVRRAGLGAVRPGDVVVVERPAPGGRWLTPLPRWPGRSRGWMIKRVAAVPGDLVPDLTHPSPLTPPLRAILADDRVPPGNFLVVGDNPGGSYDSRVFGYCPSGRLLGVVVCSLSGPARARARGRP